MAVNRIDEFMERLKSLTSEEDIRVLCETEMDYLKSELSLGSRRRATSRYRNAIKYWLKSQHPELEGCGSEKEYEKLWGEMCFNCPGLKYFRVSQDDQDEFRDSSAKILTDNLAVRQLIDADALIDRATELIQAKGYGKVVLGLALLTGRRPVELLKTAVFHFGECVDEAIEVAKLNNIERLINTPENIERQVGLLKTEDYLLFSGQLKQRNGKTAARQPFPIPTLVDPETVMDAFNRLREMKDCSGKTNDEVHDSTSRALNDAKTGCKHPKIFGDLIAGEHCSVKGLRAAYATIAHEFNDPIRAQSVYISQVLGHTENSVATSQSYAYFRLD